jgi:hypothetical protein
MPYAAAKQQPSTCKLWHALVYTRTGDWVYPAVRKNSRFPQRWRIPTIGRDSPKEKAHWLFHVNKMEKKNELL